MTPDWLADWAGRFTREDAMAAFAMLTGAGWGAAIAVFYMTYRRTP